MIRWAHICAALSATDGGSWSVGCGSDTSVLRLFLSHQCHLVARSKSISDAKTQVIDIGYTAHSQRKDTSCERLVLDEWQSKGAEASPSRSSTLQILQAVINRLARMFNKLGAVISRTRCRLLCCIWLIALRYDAASEHSNVTHATAMLRPGPFNSSKRPAVCKQRAHNRLELASYQDTHCCHAYCIASIQTVE